MHAVIALQKATGTYTPDYVPRVLKFTSLPYNKNKYKDNLSERGLLARIEWWAEKRFTKIKIFSLVPFGWCAQNVWSEMTFRAIARTLPKHGYKIIDEKFEVPHSQHNLSSGTQIRIEKYVTWR